MNTDFLDVKRRIDDLRGDLAELSSKSVVAPVGSPPIAGCGLDLLISPNELNLHHGTGVLLNRIFNPATSFNIRSREHYADKGPFRSHLVEVRGRSRPDIFSVVLKALTKESIKRIICVPLFQEDYLIGIAAKSLLGVPLIVWVMDDQIINHSQVSAESADELFALADIRYVISSEMRDAYESKFQRKFYVLPPTVNADLISHSHSPDYASHLAGKTCAMIGNIWSRAWFESLAKMIKASGWTVHWYGKGSSCRWLNTSHGELLAHNIVEKGFLPERELAKILVTYPFSIIPSGTGDAEDDQQGVTLLSLPTRMPFLLAAARIPMLIVGSEKSCSARFARRFGVGFSIGYDDQEFAAAITKLSEVTYIEECRKNATTNAHIFSDANLEEWMWKSCELHVAINDRFERPFARLPGSVISYVEEFTPNDLYGDFQVVYQNLRRLAKRGYQPDFVFDVGASTGVWSDAVHRIFPKARFILVEPLPDHYPQWYRQLHPQFEWVTAAASNENGKATFQVSNDLYGSSLFHPEDNREYQAVEVTVTTLDNILAQKKIQGRGILKIDVQFAEHLVIDGATKFLKQVDFLIMELTLQRSVPSAKTFLEMVNQMESSGFRYFDDTGDWRCPIHGTLEQKDVLFVRNEIAQSLGV